MAQYTDKHNGISRIITVYTTLETVAVQTVSKILGVSEYHVRTTYCSSWQHDEIYGSIFTFSIG